MEVGHGSPIFKGERIGMSFRILSLTKMHGSLIPKDTRGKGGLAPGFEVFGQRGTQRVGKDGGKRLGMCLSSLNP